MRTFIVYAIMCDLINTKNSACFGSNKNSLKMKNENQVFKYEGFKVGLNEPFLMGFEFKYTSLLLLKC